MRTTDPIAARALRWHLEPFYRTVEQPRAFVLDFYRERDVDPEAEPDRCVYGRTNTAPMRGILRSLLYSAIADINRLVGEWCRDFVLLHAGAVAGEGGAVLLPAAPDGGKSTTVLGLLQAGFSYLSDEFGAIDPISGRLFPVPRRIGVHRETLRRFFPHVDRKLGDEEGLLQPFFSDRYVRPEDVGARVGEPAPVKLIAFPEPDADGGPRLLSVTRAEAVERMAASAFNLRHHAERGVIMLSRIAEEAPAVRVVGRTPTERAELVRERFG